MKINSKYLHLPPHISTSWTQVRAIFQKQGDLFVSLIDGTVIAIHGIETEIVTSIFDAYAAFLEAQHSRPERPPFQLFQVASGQGGSPEIKGSLKFGFENMESMASAMQHNPAQANLPDLPKEMVNKIAEIARLVAPDEVQNMPKPEPHCNCPHCQIARAIHQIDPKTEQVAHQESIEDTVSEEDLSFQQWEIIKTGDKLYSVTNRLDQNEKYTVFLGDPVGCTCGKSGCDHILAVLKS